MLTPRHTVFAKSQGCLAALLIAGGLLFGGGAVHAQEASPGEGADGVLSLEVLPTYVVGNSGRLRSTPCAFRQTVDVHDFEFGNRKWGQLSPFPSLF